MSRLKLFVVFFTLLLCIVFQVSEVAGQTRRIKHHPVRVMNDSGTKAGVFGGTSLHRFGDIEVDVFYEIWDTDTSTAKSVVYSGVEMMAITTSFRGFGSISGTADTAYTKQFAGTLKTDEGVLNDGKVKTSLVNASGVPIALGATHFDRYDKWYDKASGDKREKYGDAETFRFRHVVDSSCVLYTAMREHQVHFGGGFSFWAAVRIKKEKKPRNLTLSDDAELEKQKVGTPTDAEIVAMFSPYASAGGEAFNEAGKSMGDLVPSISVDTTQPATKIPKKADAGEYNYGLLVSADGSYTSSAGSTHASIFYLSHTASSVEWYVRSPSGTGRGSLVETDTSTDEAGLSYTFPVGVGGTYLITGVVSPASGSGYEGSYTVSVSGPDLGTGSSYTAVDEDDDSPASTPSPTPTPTPSPASTPTLSPSGGSYTAYAGGTHTADISVPSGYQYVYWYIAGPGIDGLGLLKETDTGNGSSTSASFSWSIPSYTLGDHVITAYTYLSDGSIVQPSYTMSVSRPPFYCVRCGQSWKRGANPPTCLNGDYIGQICMAREWLAD